MLKPHSAKFDAKGLGEALKQAGKLEATRRALKAVEGKAKSKDSKEKKEYVAAQKEHARSVEAVKEVARIEADWAGGLGEVLDAWTAMTSAIQSLWSKKPIAPETSKSLNVLNKVAGVQSAEFKDLDKAARQKRLHLEMSRLVRTSESTNKLINDYNDIETNFGRELARHYIARFRATAGKDIDTEYKAKKSPKEFDLKKFCTAAEQEIRKSLPPDPGKFCKLKTKEAFALITRAAQNDEIRDLKTSFPNLNKAVSNKIIEDSLKKKRTPKEATDLFQTAMDEQYVPSKDKIDSFFKMGSYQIINLGVVYDGLKAHITFDDKSSAGDVNLKGTTVDVVKDEIFGSMDAWKRIHVTLELKDNSNKQAHVYYGDVAMNWNGVTKDNGKNAKWKADGIKELKKQLKSYMDGFDKYIKKMIDTHGDF